MKIIGFNFTKVSAEKFKGFKQGSKVGTNISFLGIEKEENALTKEDSEALRASFNFSVRYGDVEKKEAKPEGAEVSLTGFIIIMATKKESKEILESWKKKQLPNSFNVPLFNFILKKCTVKALKLEEEIGLPLHLPLPQLKAGKKEQTK